MAKTYNIICPVIFGSGAIKEIPEKVKELQGKKAFLVYDQGVKAAGISDKITALLKENNIEYAAYEDITADPKDTIIDDAAKAGKDAGVDIVIGIGGGSSLDAAKAIAVMLKNPGNIGDYYAGIGKEFTEKAPVVLVPTASGTGSESTPIAVITDTKNTVKQTILNPGDIAIVDPDLTLTVPDFVTANTGFDALAHAIEGYTVNENFQNPLSDVLSLKAISLIWKNLEKAYLDGKNLEARTNLSLGSNFAGISFAGSCVHFGHCAAHELGAQYHIAHGALCALAIPEVIEFSAEVLPERITSMAHAMGVTLPDTDALGRGKALAEEVRKYMKRVGIKALKDYEITREQAVACAKGAVENNWFVVSTPKPVDIAVMEELIGKMYDNYQ
ncbi:alcohol dehydrogenase [Acetitomaculum ruminis DSM 5522]|uniref:Alcohol dehydrogenase n=1 Tax=Acetitomaculum ruminis DSM 5522 TaxID=1120918 RepID=A0A1I0W2U1_9FIRM|nr:iron-containing alcohol dehydrogenase [Acetitomaculum ruminis]SFA82196.1 alcohol dehydrogenase [Acetitomaculum ruminis DSM 5522]